VHSVPFHQLVVRNLMVGKRNVWRVPRVWCVDFGWLVCGGMSRFCSRCGDERVVGVLEAGKYGPCDI
jgi:hypothetical protein